MAETRVDVKLDDGVMDTYLHSPSGKGPFPAVIMYFDAFGVRPAMHEMAERLASHGFLVALPNLFHRVGTFKPFDPKSVWTDNSERERLMGIMKKADAPSVMRDTAALIDVLGKTPTARAEKVGCFGYCLGGRLSLVAAGALPDRVAAAGSIHGGNMVTDEPDSPHLQAPKIKARLYFAVADNDRSCTPEAQAKLSAALDAAKVRFQLELFPGVQHGFAVTDTPAYNAEASDKHWDRLVALFSETLKTNH